MFFKILLTVLVISNLGYYVWSDETLVVIATLFDVIVFLYLVQFSTIIFLRPINISSQENKNMIGVLDVFRPNMRACK